jgi:predicted dehydrogenase
VSAPHRLLFLDPGHFHAALTLRQRHPRVADEIVVYAREGAELRDFLALVERFNTRRASPTAWRPAVVVADDPLARLLAERRGDVVVLAGKNGGKARTMRRLHEAGRHVLADKPWLVEAGDLDDVRASLAGWPLAMEIMTGRHDVAGRLLARLVRAPAVLGGFRDEAPAIELASVHHLAKTVDGAPLRRPWWYFDVRVQGSGAVDIPTHLVDQTQGLVDGVPKLLGVRTSSTRVPEAVFSRITGEPGFPAELRSRVDGDTLAYDCNAVIEYEIGGVRVAASARWELETPPGGGDTSRTLVRGTRADILLEQGPHTSGRRRLTVIARGDRDRVHTALEGLAASWQREFPGISIAPRVEREPEAVATSAPRADGEPVAVASTAAGAEAGASGRAREVVIPAGLDGGHEAHFALVLDTFLRAIDEGRAPEGLAARTLAKYEVLAAAVR